MKVKKFCSTHQHIQSSPSCNTVCVTNAIVFVIVYVYNCTRVYAFAGHCKNFQLINGVNSSLCCLCMNTLLMETEMEMREVFQAALHVFGLGFLFFD